MTIRLLLFQGNWENEGNFWALEVEHSILLFAVGENAPFLNHQEIIDHEYLTKNKTKIKAIFLSNALPKNCAFLPLLYQELSLQVPIYVSQHSLLILDYLWFSAAKIKDKFRIVEINKPLKIGDFHFRFLPLNSYVLGNLAIMVNYQDCTFYYLEDFTLHNLLNNNYLSDTTFFAQLKDLLTHQRKHTYLITSVPNLAWNRQNSLLLASRSWEKDKNYFFLLYDYDWLHILELCKLAQQWQKKIKVLDPNFLTLLKKVLKNDKLKGILEEEEISSSSRNVVHLLVGSPQNIEERLKTVLEGKHFAKKDTFTFIAGISSAHGGEAKLASVVDYLYQRKGEVWNFSRQETCSLGTTFADLKLLLDIIQPHLTITIQNSYKQKNYLAYLEKYRLLTLPNQNYLTLPNQKIYPLPVKEKWATEKILLTQRENLLQSGFLMVLIKAHWEQKFLKIKSLHLETVAITSAVNLKKLEEKIKHWWEKKVNSDLAKQEQSTNSKKNFLDSTKRWRRIIERYLEICLERYLNFEHNIEVKEPVILLFLEEQNPPKTKEIHS